MDAKVLSNVLVLLLGNLFNFEFLERWVTYELLGVKKLEAIPIVFFFFSTDLPRIMISFTNDEETH